MVDILTELARTNFVLASSVSMSTETVSYFRFVAFAVPFNYR